MAKLSCRSMYRLRGKLLVGPTMVLLMYKQGRRVQ